MAFACTFLHTPQGYSPAMLEAMIGVLYQSSLDHSIHLKKGTQTGAEWTSLRGVPLQWSEREDGKQERRERMRELKDRNCQSIQESVYMLFLALPKEAALFSEAYG